jgi:electron transfer flavoprotein beta subunit
VKIVTCYKIVRDEQDFVVAPDRTVALDGCALRIGAYDLNAIEAGVQLAASTEGSVVCLTVGGEEVRDSKLRKGVLSRGPNSMVAVVDPALATTDAGTTARALASALGQVEGVDLVICGEGSSDRYTQQVGAQVAARLAVPYVNAVSRVSVEGSVLVVERTLEDEVETLEVTLPAVISITSDAYPPRIPSMKDILGAGKKPVVELTAGELGLEFGAPAAATEPERAPEAVPRAGVMYEVGQAGEFFAAVRELLGKGAK